MYKQLSLVARTLFIRVAPHPTTFAERRAVLAILARYGKVEVFKKLNTPSSFVAVTSREDTARVLIEKSPVSYKLVRSQWDTIADNATVALEPQTSELAPRPEPMSSEDVQTHVGSSPKSKSKKSPVHSEFLLHILPGDYDHLGIINDSPLSGPWPKHPDKRTMIASTLRPHLPVNPAMPGLLDWDAFNQHSIHGHDIRPTGQNASIRSQLQNRKTPPLLRGLYRFRQENSGDQ